MGTKLILCYISPKKAKVIKLSTPLMIAFSLPPDVGSGRSCLLGQNGLNLSSGGGLL